MNQNFIRINNMLSKNRLNQLEIFFFKIKLKILNFSFISKSASGKIFFLMVLSLYAHDLHFFLFIRDFFIRDMRLRFAKIFRTN